MVSTTLQNAQLLAEKCMALAHDTLTGKSADLHQPIKADLVNKDDVDKFVDPHKQIGDIK